MGAFVPRIHKHRYPAQSGDRPPKVVLGEEKEQRASIAKMKG